jgi:hypothetical protein
LTGGKRVADTVGAGSEDFARDGRKENGGWQKGAQGLRTNGQQSLADVWAVSKAAKRTASKQEALQAVDSLDQRLGMFTKSHYTEGPTSRTLKRTFHLIIGFELIIYLHTRTVF